MLRTGGGSSGNAGTRCPGRQEVLWTGVDDSPRERGAMADKPFTRAQIEALVAKLETMDITDNERSTCKRSLESPQERTRCKDSRSISARSRSSLSPAHSRARDRSTESLCRRESIRGAPASNPCHRGRRSGGCAPLRRLEFSCSDARARTGRRCCGRSPEPWRPSRTRRGARSWSGSTIAVQSKG